MIHSEKKVFLLIKHTRIQTVLGLKTGIIRGVIPFHSYDNQ